MTDTTRASADPAPPTARDDGAATPQTAIGFGRAMAAVTFLFVALLVLHLAAQPGARALERLIGLVASVTCDEKGLAALISIAFAGAFFAWAAHRGVFKAPVLVMAEVTWLVL